MTTLNFSITLTKPILAEKTLAEIDRRLLLDGGTRYKGLMRKTLPEAEDAYREEKDEFRSHLGASQIGRECSRELWYGFRWATTRENRDEFHKGEHDGVPCSICQTIRARFIRLLNRGHLEEARFIALLKMIDCEVWTHDAFGNQFKVSMHGGHFGGSCDSVIRGIPEMPEEPVLAEMKTHNDGSFSKLQNGGVRESKPEHYDQMQIYMGGLGLKFALYMAVNKDTDALFAQIVPFDGQLYQNQTTRAKLIVMAVLPPPKINSNPGWYKCKFCNSRALCHKLPVDGKIPEPIRNCRTCIYSKPVDGGWVCTALDSTRPISKQEQVAGCGQYTQIGM